MHKRAIFILAGAVFATMLGNGMVMPFIPVYVAQFGLGGLGAGLLFSVHAATRTMLLPFIGRASDRWGRRGFLLVGVLFYAVASLAYPLADRGRGLCRHYGGPRARVWPSSIWFPWPMSAIWPRAVRRAATAAI